MRVIFDTHSEYRGLRSEVKQPSTGVFAFCSFLSVSYVGAITRMSMHSPTSAGVVKTRRNGRLASCEQCRIRKIACDHKKPSCGRCERRGIGKDCLYHAAPLTKPKDQSPTAFGQASLLSLETTAAGSIQRVAPHTPEQDAVATSLRERKGSSLPSVQGAGFLGASSSSAIMAEINDSLGIDTPEPGISPAHSPVSDEDVRRGAEVLSILRDPGMRRLMREISDRWLAWSESLAGGYLIYGSVYRVWLEELDRVLDRNWAGQSSLVLSTKIWYNTQRPLSCSAPSSAIAWARQATGENLRWEVIGLLFIQIGTEVADMPGWNAIFTRLPCGLGNRAQLMRKTLQLGNACVAFSNQCGPRNDLIACLMYLCMLMTERAVGDSSTEAWHNMGRVCDTVITLGFHQQKKVDVNTPFFLRELRNRLFNLVYNHDKFLAEFTGRPPRISYRHCTIQELSAFSDQEICASENVPVGPTINESGQPRRSVWRKAFYSLTKVREDILEITLGENDENLSSRLAHVKASLLRATESMPDFVIKADVMQLLRDIRHTPQRMPGVDALWRQKDVQALSFTKLTILRLEFLVERAIIISSQETADPVNLIAASRRLLSLCLKILSCKDYFINDQIDLIDVAYFEALPPAGVLAIELLKQDQLPNDDSNFPRSEVVQNLSILVPELEAVGPEEGNHGVCMQGANALRKVLETSLARHPQYLDGAQTAFLDGQLGFNNDAAFLDWLGNVDFDTASWLDGT